MEPQNFGNHGKRAPIMAMAVFLVGLVVAIWATVDAVRFWHQPVGCVYAFIAVLGVLVALSEIQSRMNAQVVQDRLIRLEEELRTKQLTGKSIDPRLTLKQVIALRFAGDEQFPQLAAKAAAENMDPKAIKQAVTNWRADHHRV